MADASPTSISAAAQQYQDSIHKYQPRQESQSQDPEPQEGTAASIEPAPVAATTTIEGQEQSAEHQQSPGPPRIPAQTSTQGTTPSKQQGASTPTRNVNGTAESTRASVPLEAVEHGAPFRKYLNSKVTPTLLDGMKQLALEQPKDPLRFLGDYLLQKSSELEYT